MKLPPLIPALFVERLNRFVGEVFVKGKIEKALIRNTGRLKELLKFGNTVFVREKSSGKYGYEIILSRSEKSLVCVESHYANKIFEEYVRKNRNFKDLRREVKLGKEKFDFLIDNTLIEVKSVNLVKNGIAMFPDAPTRRGRDHIRSLIRLSKKFKPLLVFVVQRSDFSLFEPNCETDPEFCKAYYEYISRGLEVLVLKCEVSLREIRVISSNSMEN